MRGAALLIKLPHADASILNFCTSVLTGDPSNLTSYCHVVLYVSAADIRSLFVNTKTPRLALEFASKKSPQD
jgi:hypothetical protein